MTTIDTTDSKSTANAGAAIVAPTWMSAPTWMMTTLAEGAVMDRTRVVQDYPKPGVVFYDMSPLLADPKVRRDAFDRLAQLCAALGPFDCVLALESRGFLVATELAARLSVGIVLARKRGKVPPPVHRVDYKLEYGSDALEVSEGSLRGLRVLIADDVLATGGTTVAACRLVTLAGGVPVAAAFLYELPRLLGRARVGRKNPTHITSLVLVRDGGSRSEPAVIADVADHANSTSGVASSPAIQSDAERVSFFTQYRHLLNAVMSDETLRQQELRLRAPREPLCEPVRDGSRSEIADLADSTGRYSASDRSAGELATPHMMDMDAVMSDETLRRHELQREQAEVQSCVSGEEVTIATMPSSRSSQGRTTTPLPSTPRSMELKEKLHVVGYKMKQNCKWDQGEFQSCVSDEEVNVTVKFREPLREPSDDDRNNDILLLESRTDDDAAASTPRSMELKERLHFVLDDAGVPVPVVSFSVQERGTSEQRSTASDKGPQKQKGGQRRFAIPALPTGEREDDWGDVIGFPQPLLPSSAADLELRLAQVAKSKAAKSRTDVSAAVPLVCFGRPMPAADDNRVVVMSHPSAAPLADGLCRRFGKEMRDGTINWNRFPDRWFNFSFEHAATLQNRDVVFVASLYDPADLLEQLCMLIVLPRQFIRSLSIVVPWFGPGVRTHTHSFHDSRGDDVSTHTDDGARRQGGRSGDGGTDRASALAAAAADADRTAVNPHLRRARQRRAVLL
ncbi:Phosphoribosyl transferase [uncultured virus]|nr:Phosphoribosyl transferase [uncultured virus]